MLHSGPKFSEESSRGLQTHNGKNCNFGTMHRLPQRLKSMWVFFNIFSSGESPKETQSEEKFKKMLILVF